MINRIKGPQHADTSLPKVRSIVFCSYLYCLLFAVLCKSGIFICPSALCWCAPSSSPPVLCVFFFCCFLFTLCKTNEIDSTHVRFWNSMKSICAVLHGLNCVTKHNFLSCCEVRSWNYQLPPNRVLGSMWQNEPAFKAFVWLLLKQNWDWLLVDVKALNYHRLKCCDMVVEVKKDKNFFLEKSDLNYHLFIWHVESVTLAPISQTNMKEMFVLCLCHHLFHVHAITWTFSELHILR